MKQALGMIEVYGYLAAVSALDSALKAANVSRTDVVKVKGGLVTVLVEGDVGAVKAAVDASAAAAGSVGTVVRAHVIPRPADDIERMLKGGSGISLPLKEQKAESGEADVPVTDAVASCKEGAPVSREEMQKMTVDALRKLARTLEITNMTRPEIRFAKKQELIQMIQAFIEREN